MVRVAFYLVVYGVSARVFTRGNVRRIVVNTRLCRPHLQRIHHCTAGGSAYAHKLLVRSFFIGQIICLRGGGQHRASLLYGKVYRHTIKCIIATCGVLDGYSCSPDILVVAVVHRIVAGRERGAIVRSDCDRGLFLRAVVLVVVSSSIVGNLCLQVMVGQRDRHRNILGSNITRGGGGVADNVLAVTICFGCTAIVQRDRLARPDVGVIISALQAGEQEAVTANQITRLHRCFNIVIGNFGIAIVDLWCNRHRRHNLLRLHGKGPTVVDISIVGDLPHRLDRECPSSIDG